MFGEGEGGRRGGGLLVPSNLFCRPGYGIPSTSDPLGVGAQREGGGWEGDIIPGATHLKGRPQRRMARLDVTRLALQDGMSPCFASPFKTPASLLLSFRPKIFMLVLFRC